MSKQLSRFLSSNNFPWQESFPSAEPHPVLGGAGRYQSAESEVNIGKDRESEPETEWGGWISVLIYFTLMID